MKMLNIILQFFILAIFSNVKAATFQDANNNRPQSIGYVSINKPFVTLSKFNESYIQCLDEINKFLREQSENIKYAYEGTNYHLVITDFDISIDNSSPYLSRTISKNRTEALKIGTNYFINYIKDNIKHLFSRNMHKYDFENNYGDNLNILANDLKKLMYEQFDMKFEQDLIKYENEPKNKRLRDSAKQIFYTLVHNSKIKIRGYFIKISKDGNYAHLSQNKTLYFNIIINEKNVNVTHDLKIPIPNVVKLVANISGES
ncbi:fam-d protein [Plasmodium chabaudi adami]|uniref:Fam-d protein n=1 Tax=Plasmodium chabaudi adami TaxID=5826 RepID=A0A1C6YD14_PLACE|nr:fam-d protein [Plasmodium chabaudi adami]